MSQAPKPPRSKITQHSSDGQGLNGLELPYMFIDDLTDDRDLQDPHAVELTSRWIFSKDLVSRARNAGGL